ncbi:MAG: hypothetical protein ACP5KW_09190 [Thermoproteota archaeon]|jgi:hypothetical protein
MERETLFALLAGIIIGGVGGFVAGETIQIGSNMLLVAGALAVVSLLGGFLLASTMKKRELPENLIAFPQAVSVIDMAVRRVRRSE